MKLLPLLLIVLLAGCVQTKPTYTRVPEKAYVPANLTPPKMVEAPVAPPKPEAPHYVTIHVDHPTNHPSFFWYEYHHAYGLSGFTLLTNSPSNEEKFPASRQQENFKVRQVNILNGWVSPWATK